MHRYKIFADTKFLQFGIIYKYLCVLIQIVLYVLHGFDSTKYG